MSSDCNPASSEQLRRLRIPEEIHCRVAYGGRSVICCECWFARTTVNLSRPFTMLRLLSPCALEMWSTTISLQD